MEFGLEVVWLCNLSMAFTSFRGRQGVAHAPAGHGKRLRKGSDYDDVLFRVGQPGDGEGFYAAVHEMRIAFIGEQPNFVAAAKFQDALEFVRGNHDARGIVGRIDDRMRVREVISFSTAAARRQKSSPGNVGTRTSEPPAYLTMSG